MICECSCPPATPEHPILARSIASSNSNPREVTCGRAVSVAPPGRPSSVASSCSSPLRPLQASQIWLVTLSRFTCPVEERPTVQHLSNALTAPASLRATLGPARTSGAQRDSSDSTLQLIKTKIDPSPPPASCPAEVMTSMSPSPSASAISTSTKPCPKKSCWV